MLHTVAFPHGVGYHPCIANACTARVCIADQVVVTERCRASGGSDPCKRWAPSRMEAGCILTSAVGAKGPRPWRTFREDGASANETAVCGARPGCNPSVRFRDSSPAQGLPCLAWYAFMAPPSVPRFRPLFSYSPFALAMLSTVIRVDQNRATNKRSERQQDC